MDNKRHLGLLLARGGSKRIPGKNVKPFAGKPILLWPLETLLDSGIYAKVIVSSDSEQILSLSREAGAETPFVRPEHLANDYATSLEVVRHAVAFLEASGEKFDSVCFTFGTSVFLEQHHLVEALRLLDTADAVMAATAFEHPIQRAFTIDDDKTAHFPPRSMMNARTQDLAVFYHDVGLLYWVKTSALSGLKEKDAHLCDLRVKVLAIPGGSVHDIDDAADWRKAEQIFSFSNVSGTP